MLTAVVVGAGHRSLYYASYAKSRPDRLCIVGVVDPNPRRREVVAREHNLSPDRCYESVGELCKESRFADFAINGTMDQLHVVTSLPLLERGYHLLLEKPFATSERDLWTLVDAARDHHRKVAICHVLRYAPFYAHIRAKLLEGVIGDVLSIQATEHVSYHHMAVGYVRGKWNNEARCGSSMLMAKSCHDLDLIAWMKSGVRPVRVASFGGNYQFRPERAPARAGTRCLVDCPIEKECLYSARKHYIDHPNRWSFYVWDSIEHIEKPTIEDKIESLRTTNPYGRCVWKCDNDVVDHQTVAIEFEDNTTATLNMIGGSAKPDRTIHIVGTRGEIQGEFSTGTFRIRSIDPRPGHEYAEEEFDTRIHEDISGASGGHGGGDLRLVSDFVKVLNGRQPSISSTALNDSVAGHLLGFYADRARRENRGMTLPYERLSGI